MKSKIFHYLNFIFIVLLLGGICVIEEVIVSDSLKTVQSNCYEIEQILKDDDSLKNMEVVMAVDNLEYVWTQNESRLCFMVNHKNIQEIGQEIVRLKTYIAFDEMTEFKVSLSEILHYCYGYLHFMGANIHNVL
ncbi:MAG: DUF4363 family protein [Clostridia bacterium]|nr:DUF4363 family protein [Clostridia bacterium]MBQ8792040.1 DUF4363 family protein [Clostridia bacterium]